MYFFYTSFLFLLTPLFSVAQSNNSSTAIVLGNHTLADFKLAVKDLIEAQGIEVTIRRNPVIHFEYESEETRLSAMELLTNRGFSLSGKNDFPVDFPLLPADADEQAVEEYHQQKTEWIAGNPERYAALHQSSGLTIISQEEFDQMSSEKQQHILDHPDLYSIE